MEGQDGKVSKPQSGQNDEVYSCSNKEENSEAGWNSEVEGDFSIDSQDDYNMQTDDDEDEEEEDDDNDDFDSEYEEYDMDEYPERWSASAEEVKRLRPLLVVVKRGRRT